MEQEHHKSNRTSIFISLFLIVILGYFIVGLLISRNAQSPQVQYVQKTVATPTLALSEVFSYKGEPGKDALTVLKEKAKVEQDGSGMVSAINDRKANSSDREYWAFYVNGKLSDIGAGDYITKDGDQIDWKIEKY